jgi:hypothetical protein
MVPYRYDNYWLSATHLDCWLGEMEGLYPAIVPQIPPGVGYYVRTRETTNASPQHQWGDREGGTRSGRTCSIS